MTEKAAFSGTALFYLWFLLLVWFYTGVGAIFGFGTQRESGFPAWVLLLRIVVFISFFATTFFTLGRRKLAVWGFWVTAVLMIPVTVTFNYYFNLNIADFVLTAGWIVQTTIVTTIIVLIMVGIYNYVIRDALYTFY